MHRPEHGSVLLLRGWEVGAAGMCIGLKREPPEHCADSGLACSSTARHTLQTTQLSAGISG